MDNIFGEELKNSGKIFMPYIKDMKLKSTNEYFYIIRDNTLGDVLFVNNPGSVILINCDNIHEKYLNKMYSVNAILGKTVGYETEVGVLENMDYITKFNAIQLFEKALNCLKSIVMDITTANDIKNISGLNNDEMFYNNVLLNKAADGVSKYILDNRAIYLAPNMLPGTKKTDLDAKIYYTNGNPYFLVEFISHKSKDVRTFMKFLCL